ncbi:MAG: peptidase M3, partial [Bacteroidetes bacterium]|nr:peptidase M3 [Bacteroidota bacterium]
MKNHLFKWSILALLLGFACTNNSKKDMNPLLIDYSTPFQVPPFNDIKLEHYKPAFDEGIKLQKAEVAAIADSKEAPTFENTILALEESGKVLDKVATV